VLRELPRVVLADPVPLLLLRELPEAELIARGVSDLPLFGALLPVGTGVVGGVDRGGTWLPSGTGPPFDLGGMLGSVGDGFGNVPVPGVSLPVGALALVFPLLPGAALKFAPALIPPAPTLAVVLAPARIPPAPAAPIFAPPPALAAPPAF